MVYQPCALQMPYCPINGWPIKFPEIPDTKTENLVIIVHFQDSLTYKNNQCLELEKVREYFGDLCRNVVVVVEDFNLANKYPAPFKIIWFPTFCYEMMHQCKNIEPQWGDYINTENTKTWQCLNGIPKQVREKVAYYLQENFNNGILSLGGGHIDLPSHAYDDVYWGKGNDNPQNFLMLDWVYRDCAVNIVNETVYEQQHGIITEKTLFAFLAGQIPICIGTKGMVKEFKNMGFDMFEDIVDISYDNLPDNIRWKAAIDLNADLLRSNIKRSEYLERLIFNKHYALTVWPQRCIDWYESQVHSINLQWNN